MAPAEHATPQRRANRGALPLHVTEADGSSGSSRHNTPVPRSSGSATHPSAAFGTKHDAPHGPPAMPHAMRQPAHDGNFADGPSSSESYSPRAAERACRGRTMRTPYGESSLLFSSDHDARAHVTRARNDELDYFVPIVQKQSRDLHAIFHSARGGTAAAAMAGVRDKGARSSRHHPVEA
jgi:hypothetical protein